jgi:hypothetical protein
VPRRHLSMEKRTVCEKNIVFKYVFVYVIDSLLFLKRNTVLSSNKELSTSKNFQVVVLDLETNFLIPRDVPQCKECWIRKCVVKSDPDTCMVSRRFSYSDATKIIVIFLCQAWYLFYPKSLRFTYSSLSTTRCILF